MFFAFCSSFGLSAALAVARDGAEKSCRLEKGFMHYSWICDRIMGAKFAPGRSNKFRGLNILEGLSRKLLIGP